MITWAGPSGTVRRVIDYGCLDHRQMNELIDDAVDRLPVQ